MELWTSLLVEGSEMGNGVPRSFLEAPTKKQEIELFSWPRKSLSLSLSRT